MAHVEQQDRALISRAVDVSFRQIVLATGYAVAGAVLLWSRFAGIGTSLWHDEIYTLQTFVDPGPRAIFGAYNPNDHILFSVLGWLTVHSTGLGDSVYRLWSVVPFIVGVGSVTFWLHKRLSPAIALIFAALCTTSSLLLMLSTEARGYGLAFFAMCVMTVAACEAAIRPSERALTALAAAGVIGCWTLPTFILPLAGVSLVLLGRPATRRPLAARLLVASVAIGAWYAVPADNLLSSRGQQFGVTLPWHAPLTGAANALGAAFFPWTDPAALAPTLVAFPVLIAGVISLRRRFPALVVVTVVPVVFSFTALTISRFYVAERFVSFLLVPILVIAAFGLEALVRLPTTMGAPLRTRLRWALSVTYAGTLVLVSLAFFAFLSFGVTRLPPEANRDAARAIAGALSDAPRPVIVNTEIPADLRYYLGAVPLRTVPAGRLQQLLCSDSLATTGVIFVQEPYRVHLVDASCLTRRGASVQVFHQWDRGFRITVWELPPKT
jgi:hypothetical protein